MRARIAEVGARAQVPVDGASLAALRVLFGFLSFVGAVRFLAYGWVERFFVTPRFYFKYWGFEWVEVLSPYGMKAAFVSLAVLSLLVALGLFYRAAIVLWLLLFSYIEFIDVANYLNHYYLLSVLAVWMCFMPLGRVYGLDGRLFGGRTTVPRWMLAALRLQVACVYFYAGIAKLTGDWLLHAQPLSIWMSARTDTPVIGPLLAQPWVPWFMSWGGFLFDTTIPLWLSLRRTRALAYPVVLAFHSLVGLLFNIGMFPWIMVSVATVFFDPSWPRRLLSRWWASEESKQAAPPLSGGRVLVALGLGGFALFQVLFPLRTYAYGGDVLWHEQGMRWSWRVMCREKNGSVSYRVRLPGRSQELRVPPSRYLTPHQEREMAGQPDLILQLAHHIGEEFEARGYEGVEVRVDALVSLNGRPMRPLIDPDANLLRVADGLGRASWILPGPSSPPRFSGGRFGTRDDVAHPTDRGRSAEAPPWFERHDGRDIRQTKRRPRVRAQAIDEQAQARFARVEP